MSDVGSYERAQEARWGLTSDDAVAIGRVLDAADPRVRIEDGIPYDGDLRPPRRTPHPGDIRTGHRDDHTPAWRNR